MKTFNTEGLSQPIAEFVVAVNEMIKCAEAVIQADGNHSSEEDRVKQFVEVFNKYELPTEDIEVYARETFVGA